MGSEGEGLSPLAWYLVLRGLGQRTSGPESESPVEEMRVGDSTLVGLHTKSVLPGESFAIYRN